jgi:hypothetical protein
MPRVRRGVRRFGLLYVTTIPAELDKIEREATGKHEAATKLQVPE